MYPEFLMYLKRMFLETYTCSEFIYSKRKLTFDPKLYETFSKAICHGSSLDSSTQLDSSTEVLVLPRQLVQLLDSSTELDSSTRRVDATSYDGSTDASPSEISAFGVSLRASTGSTYDNWTN